MVPLAMLFASHDADASASGIIWPRKSCCNSLQSSWAKKFNGAIYNAVCMMWHWQWCQWHHVMPMAAVSHDQKSHVAPHFDYLDARNIVVLLTMLMALYDASISGNGMTWPEKSCCSSFQSSWPNKCKVAIDTDISIYCCLCQCQWQHMTKKSCCSSFQSFWHNEWNSTIDNVIRIMWHWHQWQ